MREITQRVRDQDRLRRVLAEKSRIAAALQASMIPPILPDVAGTELASRYEPAGDGSEVGGDFLDVFGLDQQSWAFVLGDVSGKGAEAAAVSAAARYTLRALADPDRGPAETVAEVNAKLLAQTDAERHCTLILGYLRPTDGGTSVTLTLAGHHPPLLLRTTGEVEEVGRPGTALALFDEPELHDTTLVMAPGEVLCAYTDGLVEARQGSDMFGSQRVTELLRRHGHLPVDELAGMLWEAVRAFHGGQLQDDVALLLVKVSVEGPRSTSALRGHAEQPVGQRHPCRISGPSTMMRWASATALEVKNVMPETTWPPGSHQRKAGGPPWSARPAASSSTKKFGTWCSTS
jgi:serine phosphatase RsbU (regulator of sigma subunit)